MKYHYTIGDYLPGIMRSGIRPATANVPAGVRPVVWLTTSEEWEQTANKGALQGGKIVDLSTEQTHALCGGLVRIAISPKVKTYPFLKLMRLSKESPRGVWALRTTAEAQGSNPLSKWWGTMGTIEYQYFLTIERYENGTWTEDPGPYLLSPAA